MLIRNDELDNSVSYKVKWAILFICIEYQLFWWIFPVQEDIDRVFQVSKILSNSLIVFSKFDEDLWLHLSGRFFRNIDSLLLISWSARFSPSFLGILAFHDYFNFDQDLYLTLILSTNLIAIFFLSTLIKISHFIS